jgi:hypothetical protein
MKRLFLIATSVVALLSAAGKLKAAEPDGGGSASAYCTQTGGRVIDRAPMYGTNGPSSSWLRLTGTRQFCQYTSSKDGSRIHVLLETLYATTPTLAALAYYAKVPLGTGCVGNPGSCYCSQLGGSDLFGGINAAGGGWYGRNSQDSVLEACIFPDMSSIDSWGLAYYSNGDIRGIDLSTVLRYGPPPAAKK